MSLSQFLGVMVVRPHCWHSLSHTQHPLACRWRKKMRGRRTQEEHTKWSCLRLWAAAALLLIDTPVKMRIYKVRRYSVLQSLPLLATAPMLPTAPTTICYSHLPPKLPLLYKHWWQARVRVIIQQAVYIILLIEWIVELNGYISNWDALLLYFIDNLLCMSSGIYSLDETLLFSNLQLILPQYRMD